MNSLAKTLLTLTLSIINLTAQAGFEKRYTDKGYPYKQLVKRSEVVKIIYSENDNNVNCQVEVEINDQAFRMSPQKSASEDFNRSPLASCLERKQAIELLSKTF